MKLKLRKNMPLPVLDPFHPSVVNFVKDPGKLYEGISYSSFENNVLRIN